MVQLKEPLKLYHIRTRNYAQLPQITLGKTLIFSTHFAPRKLTGSQSRSVFWHRCPDRNACVHAGAQAEGHGSHGIVSQEIGPSALIAR